MNKEVERRPGRVRNPKTHRAILDAARQLLTESDYTSISIERIAELSGTSKPTIYRWWPTKAALFIELYNEDADRLFAIPDKNNLQEELVLFFQATWQLWQETAGGQAYRSIIAETQQNKEAFIFFTQIFLPARQQPLKAIIERARARGELSEQFTTDMLVSLVFGFNWYHLLTNTPPSKKEYSTIAQLLSRQLHY